MGKNEETNIVNSEDNGISEVDEGDSEAEIIIEPDGVIEPWKPISNELSS